MILGRFVLDPVDRSEMSEHILLRAPNIHSSPWEQLSSNMLSVSVSDPPNELFDPAGIRDM